MVGLLLNDGVIVNHSLGAGHSVFSFFRMMSGI